MRSAHACGPRGGRSVKRLCDRDICFIAGSLGQGGAERQLYYMLRALSSSGARVRVLSLTSGEFWERRIQDLGVEVVYIGCARSRVGRLRAIVSHLRRRRPDFIQSQHFFANLYAALAGRCTGIADIGAIRSNAHHEIRNGGPVFGRLNLRLPRALFVNSRAALENAVRQRVRRERLHFVGNVVDTHTFAPAACTDRETIRILSVGRLIALKRHDLLLRAAAALPR